MCFEWGSMLGSKLSFAVRWAYRIFGETQSCIMKKLLSTSMAFLVFCALSFGSDTTLTAPIPSGNWTTSMADTFYLDGAPLSGASSLTIEEGVVVVLPSSWSISGEIDFAGTSAQPIVVVSDTFHAPSFATGGNTATARHTLIDINSNINFNGG